MKFFELGTAVLVGVAVYWVVIGWFEKPLCYVQTNEAPFVAKWMSCDEIPADWHLIEVKE